MKTLKLTMFFTCLFIMGAIVACNAQSKCDDLQYTSAAFSYVFPEGLGAEAGITFDKGIIHTANIGVAYQTPKYHTVKKGEQSIDSLGNVLDIYTYIGWRLFRKDYVLSIYGNVGYCMGDAAGFDPLASIKFLIPIEQFAVSVEPFYIMNRGASLRLSAHFKL